MLVGTLERNPCGVTMSTGDTWVAGRTVFLGRALTARKFLGKGMWYVELVDDMVLAAGLEIA